MTTGSWRILAVDFGQEIQAAHARQAQIAEHHVGAVDELEPFLGGGGLVDLEARGHELQLQYAAQFLFVFDNQNAFFHAAGWWRAIGGRSMGSETEKNAAFAGLALHWYLTAVFVHNFVDDGEAEADALRLGGEERVEDVLRSDRA